MELAVADHFSLSLSRLLQQFKGKPYREALYEVFARQFQEIEEALHQIIDERFLDTATGEQLKILARIVGQPETGASESEFRTFIKARILANRSNGTTPEIIDLFKLLEPSALVEADDFYHATLVVRLSNVVTSAANAAIYGTLLRKAKQGGVATSLHYWTHTPASAVFGFAGGGFEGWADAAGSGGGNWAASV